MTANRSARWPLALVALVWLYAAAKVYAGARQPPKPPECPTHAECWDRELACDKVPSSKRYACRAKVRTECMDKAERCWGGWSI